jgi:nucleotide-binding universal stress UspA family protein
MSGVILALLDRPSAAPKVLAAARRAAQLMGATRINVLAIRTPPIDMVTATEGFLSFPDDGEARAAEGRRIAALAAAFQDWSRESGAPSARREPGTTAAEWIELEGWADQLVDEWGERSDLIVLQRPAANGTEPERRAVHAALFDTGRPVLVVPEEALPSGLGERVAVAWRNDARTTQAVLGALRWLGGAAEMHVMAGAKRWETPPALPPIFSEHSVPATLHVLPMSGQRAFGEALLARARALQADLLVLGAFAHPMLFGPILGGVTKHMLAHADLPVLMRY